MDRPNRKLPVQLFVDDLQTAARRAWGVHLNDSVKVCPFSAFLSNFGTGVAAKRAVLFYFAADEPLV